MPGLAGVLRYDKFASSIARVLNEGTEINVIQGAPGVGKSWLAKGIGALWEESDGCTVVAQGEELQTDSAFYVLNLALAALSSAWRSVGSDLVTAARAGEHAAGTAGVITATVEMLVHLRPARQKARKLYLGELEQQILFEFERLAKGRPLLVIADNLHWWDAASLELLGRLREPRMGEAFPFLADMRLIAVQTVEPYQKTAHPLARDALLSTGPTRYHELDRVSRDVFPDVLVALGAPQRQAVEAADVIFAFTGGHLLLTDRCANRMQDDDAGPLLSSADTDEFLRRLLNDRLGSLGPVGANALAILQIAAVLGLTFRRADVVCTYGGSASDAASLLRDCRDEDIIELSEDVGQFVHDLFRQHFLGTGALDTTRIHESVSDCLRLLRPADYELRCQHAVHAERGREAASLGIRAGLQRQRDGLFWRALPAHVLSAIEHGGMTAIAETFEAALAHLNAESASACQTTLSSLPRNLPRSLVAEADYLRATCLIATRSEDDREAAQAVLAAWAGYESEEPELGIRLMHLHLYALSLLVDKAPGRDLEGKIRQALIARGDFDQAAEDAMYTLDRCSGSLHEPEASLVRIHEATRHFGPVKGQSVIRRPVEYYRCLVNLGAKLVTNARYEEARAMYEQLDALVGEYAPGTFPRLDFPLTTALLAEYRLGIVGPDDAALRQREIAEAHEVASDPFYPQNALAVYLTLAGVGDEALQIFDSLDEALGRRSRPAPSMLYLVRANRCAVRYVAGEPQAARLGWTALVEVVERIPYLIRRYLIPRHRLLGEVMERGDALSPIEFDTCLLGVSLFGPLWDQLGRGFRMPEVEWWY